MTANEEGKTEIRTEPDLVLEIQKMRSELIAATEEIKKHQTESIQELESKMKKEVSEKLQSFQALIPKMLKSNGNSERLEKKFKLKHVFKNVDEFKENVQNYSEKKYHFNVNWQIMTQRLNDNLGLFIFCEPIAAAEKWSIRTKFECIVVCTTSQDGFIRTWDYCYDKNMGWGSADFLEWKEMKDWFLVDGSLTVEVTVTILEATGLAKEKLRMFDESQKDVSDVILVVRDTKFYVSKMFLASQSPVFKALLLGGFSESKQSEVTLNGIDPDDFHYFLEVVYGESAIDDTTVEGVALLADMYDVPNAIRKCEEFLLEKSKKTLGKKLEIATCYHLKKLEENCISEIEAVQNVRSEVPKDDDHQTKFDFIKVLIDFLFICLFVIVVAIGLSIILIVL